jgi:PleD family two-component response regulator
MKADEAMKDVPVVMYSADPREDKIIEARDLGALDYVIKGSTDIHSLVQRFCTTGSSSTPAAEAKESPTSPG